MCGVVETMMAEPATVFQATDLSQHSSEVLDTARAGEARVRDKDGHSFLVLPEQRVRVLAAVGEAAVNLVALEQALGVAPDDRPRPYSGDWTWLRHLDDDDLREFISNVRDALLAADREQSPAPVEDILYRWRVTAEELADPDRRPILLRLDDLRDEDFVDLTINLSSH